MKLRKHENNVLAWKGDAALLFITRLVLTEIYPVKLPIKCLMKRQERAVSNGALNAYCKRHNLDYGCNVMEIKIGEMVIAGKLEEAKEVARDIIKNDKLILNMDKQQLCLNGEVNEQFVKDCHKREQMRMEKKRFFEKIKQSTAIPQTIKHRLTPYVNKIVHFLLICKYRWRDA
jgi:hypothetical protein